MVALSEQSYERPAKLKSFSKAKKDELLNSELKWAPCMHFGRFRQSIPLACFCASCVAYRKPKPRAYFNWLSCQIKKANALFGLIPEGDDRHRHCYRYCL